MAFNDIHNNILNSQRNEDILTWDLSTCDFSLLIIKSTFISNWYDNNIHKSNDQNLNMISNFSYWCFHKDKFISHVDALLRTLSSGQVNKGLTHLALVYNDASLHVQHMILWKLFWALTFTRINYVWIRLCLTKKVFVVSGTLSSCLKISCLILCFSLLWFFFDF